MPTAMTYNSLLGDLQGYLERGGVTDTTVFNQLPRLVNNAEREIAQELKILGFLTPLTSAFVAGTSVYAKPDRWRSTASMEFGVGLAFAERRPLYPRSYEYCRRYWPNSDTHGVPKFYADYDFGHWLIVPTPDLAYPWQPNVYRMPALLGDSSQTNWLTDYAPVTLLNKCMQMCWMFLKDEARAQAWAALYQESSASLNGQDLQRIIDRNTAREEV